ncbi:MAG: histidinol-phosphate transaminase [Pseudomonadota bacterium]
MGSPTPQPGVLEIAPYKPGRAKLETGLEAVKLSANENCLGPSPKAAEAARRAAGALHVYPEPSAAALREALAEAYDLDAARIVCGAGSDELIALLVNAYVGQGDNVVQSRHGFLMYAIAAQAAGAEARFAPEKGLRADVDALLAQVSPDTRILFLANPNNPTGSYLGTSDIRRLREALREDVLLVLDAAYAEYVDAPDYEPGAALVDEYDNVVMLRTFSKIYALASLRLGWAYCSAEVADVLNRVRGPFNVNGVAQAAGVAALRDKAHTMKSVRHNASWRAWLAQQLGGLGLEVSPSVANFVLVHFSGEGLTAAAAEAALRENGLLVRGVDEYGLPDALRITVGAEEANRRVVATLADALDAVRS